MVIKTRHYDIMPNIRNLILFSFVFLLKSSTAFPSTLAVPDDGSIRGNSTSEPERIRRSSSYCGNNQLLEEDTGQCYSQKTQGPCGDLMVFDQSLEDPNVGRCDCVQTFERALIYEPKSKQCYPIFTQGPCESGSWLVITNGRPECELNPCSFFMYYFEYKGREFVSYNHDCVELNKASTKCANENEIIVLTDKGKTPACVKKSSISPLSLWVPVSLICKKGDVLSYNNECQPVTEFV